MGIYSPKGRIAFTHRLPLETGQVAFISQSGGLASRHSHVGIVSGYNFSKVISVGNQIDLDLFDFLNYFRTDADTKVISMYVENLKRDGNKFVKLLKQTTKEKPVIIWKGGKLKAGHGAVISHTGGLAGNIKLWRSMATQTGAILVNNFQELIEMIQACLHLKVPQSLGTAILTGGGGPAVEMTDECEAYGLEVPKITESAQRMINEFIPEVNSNLSNPLEFGANGGHQNSIKVIKILDKEPHLSSIMITNNPERYTDRGLSMDEVVNDLAESLSPNSDKNLISIHMSFGQRKETVEAVNNFYSKAKEKGIIVYKSVESAAKCIYRLWSYGNYLKNQ
ncbi:hypothetical protein LCGC14_1545680 [marine sediment metagenome]|uniref:Succinyl-CoA synthetase-like flavodoxin domain-containing protein n=1 Tax=marine sediment metagenome TaxID=412755 RepID=A0A0F9IRR5_9ZZZZ|nr:hypothetical protein [archaeon]HEC37445.1 hypothetical protein [bacterium]